MIIDAIRNKLSENRALFDLYGEGVLSVELRAPWRVSGSSRPLYYIYCGDASMPSLVVKDAQPLFAPSPPLAVAPFISSLMPRQGVFSLLDQVFVWTEFIQGLALLDILRRDQPHNCLKRLFSRLRGRSDDFPPATRKVFVEFAQCLLAEQVEQAQQASMSLGELCSILEPRIAFPGGRNMLRDFLGACYPLHTPVLVLCSWSHGDLWPRDIFITPAGFRVIDWEWSAPQAPLGADIVDLLVTTAQHALGYTMEESWSALFRRSMPLFNSIQDMVLRHHTPETWHMLLQYCLLRSLGRELAQDGPGKRLWERYAALVGTLKKEGVQKGGHETIRHRRHRRHVCKVLAASGLRCPS